MAWYDNYAFWQAFKWTWGNEAAHSGIDLGMPCGTPLTAALPGTIIVAGRYPWGGQVSERTTFQGQPVVVSWLHMSSENVQVGQQVNAGQSIGASGQPPSPQYGSGCHVHFEMNTGTLAPYVQYNVQDASQGNHPISPQPLLDFLKAHGTPPLNPALAAIEQAGFSGASATIAAAIAMAESGLNANATHTNSDGSIDRGLFQINNRAHPEVSDSCAFNLQCAAQAAFKISNGGTDFSQWTTYTSGAYKQYTGQFSTLSDSTASTSSGAATQDCGPMPGPIDIITNSAAWVAWLGCQAQNGASAAGGATSGYISMLGQLMSWLGGGINNIQRLIPFIKDPVRILKLVAGVGLVFVASIAIFLPDVAALGVAAAGAPELAPLVRSSTKQAMSGHPARAAAGTVHTAAQKATSSIKKPTSKKRAPATNKPSSAGTSSSADRAPKGHGSTGKPALGAT